MTAKLWRCRVCSVRNAFPSYMCRGCSSPFVVDLHKHQSSQHILANVQYSPIYPLSRYWSQPAKGKGKGKVKGNDLGHGNGKRKGAPIQDLHPVSGWRATRAKQSARVAREAEAASMVSAFLAADGTDQSMVSDTPSAASYHLASAGFARLAGNLEALPEAKAVALRNAADAKARAEASQPLAVQAANLERAIAAKSKEHDKLHFLLVETQTKLDASFAEGLELEQKLDAVKARIVASPIHPSLTSVEVRGVDPLDAINAVSGMAAFLTQADLGAGVQFQNCLRYLASLQTEASPGQCAQKEVVSPSIQAEPRTSGATDQALKPSGPLIDIAECTPVPLVPSVAQRATMARAQSLGPRGRARASANEDEDADGFIPVPANRSRSSTRRLQSKTTVLEGDAPIEYGLRYFSQLARLDKEDTDPR